MGIVQSEGKKDNRGHVYRLAFAGNTAIINDTEEDGKKKLDNMNKIARTGLRNVYNKTKTLNTGWDWETKPEGVKGRRFHVRWEVT